MMHWLYLRHILLVIWSRIFLHLFSWSKGMKGDISLLVLHLNLVWWLSEHSWSCCFWPSTVHWQAVRMLPLKELPWYQANQRPNLPPTFLKLKCVLDYPQVLMNWKTVFARTGEKEATEGRAILKKDAIPFTHEVPLLLDTEGQEGWK